MATMSTIEGGTRGIEDGLKVHIDFANRRCYSPNLMNYSIWTPGSGSIAASASMFGITQYELNGLTQENIRILGTDPFGLTSAVVWSSTTTDAVLTAQTGADDGGWNSGYIDIDNRKMYRYSVWIKKNLGVPSSGLVYLGMHNRAPNSANIIPSTLKNTGFQTTNPYFHYVEDTAVPSMGGTNVWTLFVGHVWPYATATGSIEPGSNISNPSLPLSFTHPDSGVWTVSSGKVGITRGATDSSIANASDWIWNPSATMARHRAYLFYGATTSLATASFIYPRIDVVDGFEPTIQELLQGPEPARNLAKDGQTLYAYHQTNYSPNSGGCLRTERDRFMGFVGTMSSSFTVRSASVWFRPDSTVTSSSPAQMLFKFDSDVGPDGWSISIGDGTLLYSGETITLAGQKPGSPLLNTRTVVSGISISGGQWHNIAVNWNGSKFDIYLDGEIQTTAASPDGHVDLRNMTGYGHIGGRLATGGAPVSFDGRISSVMAWERSLTSSEISRMFVAGKKRFY